MKKLSKLTAMALSAAMVCSLAACSSGGGNAGTPSPNPGQSGAPVSSIAPSAPAAGDTYTVGICQLAPHPALDAATQGFKDALTEALGDSVKFEEGNAGGEYNNCATIVDGFLSANVDLILANATYPLQAAASATDTVPILGTSVTNYAVALSLDDVSTQLLGNNISGTSDLAPLDEQANMLHDMFPDAKEVGLLYCSGEPNSVYQIETITTYLTDLGYNCSNYAFTDVNDLSAVTQAACDASDVIYVPTDNTAANNTETIANVVLAAGVPVIAGESGICSGCGVATLSIDYHDLGYTAGQMAVKILTGEADVSTMPIEYAPSVTKMYNAANCEALGITPPEGYEPIA